MCIITREVHPGREASPGRGSVSGDLKVGSRHGLGRTGGQMEAGEAMGTGQLGAQSLGGRKCWADVGVDPG